MAPEAGWFINNELTRGDLESAYHRLVGLNEDKTPAPPEGEVEASVAVDVSELTIAELIDRIVEAVKEALAQVTTERQTLSPTRPIWR